MENKTPHELLETFSDEHLRCSEDKYNKARSLAISKYFEIAIYNRNVAISEALSTFFKEIT